MTHESGPWSLGQYNSLLALLQSRRYQLIHTDWRSLRGVPFEQFLVQVFEELGYRVETTKTTGDQGVDLIAIGRSRIAIQAKGYEGSVGNSAVQAVFAGMKHYRCDSCVVVTNSRFTSGAETLAQSVNCVLIDGSAMADLIDGRVF